MLTNGFLEGMNGTLFFLCVCCEMMFGIYIAKEIAKNGYVRARLQAAISIAVFVAGDGSIRGWVWWWRHQLNRGLDVEWMQGHPILMIGALIEIFGIMCMIRVFAPDSWGKYVWAIFAALSVFVAGGFVLI
nr:MAG TPA: GGDEF domain protein [Caudoviricetes sp.]